MGGGGSSSFSVSINETEFLFSKMNLNVENWKTVKIYAIKLEIFYEIW